MKKILIAILTIGTLCSNACKKEALLENDPPVTERGNQILVRFQNSTGSNIEEAQMEFNGANITAVGPVQAGETTNYIVFDDFEIGYYPGGDYEFPIGTLNGKKDGAAFSAWSLNRCGTGVEYKQLDPGQYTIEIIKAGNDSPWAYQIKFID